MPERRVTFSDPKSFTVRDLPEAERPRERLAKHGAQALSSAELLAVLLGKGTKGEPVTLLAQKLLSRFGSLKGIAEASLEELETMHGLGFAKAAQLKAAGEIARRMQTESDVHGTARISGAQDVFKLLRAKISNYTKEHFFVLSLDTRDGLLGVDEVSVGTLTTNLAHPRETFEVAIRRRAARIIIAHNHPSGDPTPSTADLEVTRRLADAGRLIGIELLDHVIFGSTNTYSCKEHGVLA